MRSALPAASLDSLHVAHHLLERGGRLLQARRRVFGAR
jgi:hypothetical protein